MQNNLGYQILFEGTVRDAYQSSTTDPPSEVVYIEYDVPPIPVYDVIYNEETEQCDKTLAYMNDKSWMQIVLPEYRGLKCGDKIQIIKVA